MITTHLKFIADAYNQYSLDGWMENDWFKPNGQTVKNVDLWEDFVALLDEIKVVIEWIPKEQ